MDNREKIYDNSKDALAYIAREYGADVLFQKSLIHYLLDFVPTLEKKRKSVVKLIIAQDVALILKKGQNAGAQEQELRYRQAVQRLVDDYGIEKSLAKSVMLDFAGALGWKVKGPAEEAERQRSEEEERGRRQQEQQRQQQKQQQRQQQGQQGQQQGAGGFRVGQRNVKFGPYYWRVLDVQNGAALLLSENVLERMRYGGFRGNTWAGSSLRNYLICDFLKNFSDAELEQIVRVKNKNPNSPTGVQGGGDTEDMAFALSIEEVVKYFGDSGAFRAVGARGGDIDDQYNAARQAKDLNGPTMWWLRSVGSVDGNAAYVEANGRLCVSGEYISRYYFGVRPAMWVIASPSDGKRREDALRQRLRGLQAGQRNVKFGPYKWRVLDVDAPNARTLLLTEDLVGNSRCYHSAQNMEKATWETCGLRKYLNGEFLREFSDPEKRQIVEVVNVNPGNPWYGTNGGNDTRDSVFLLSIEEVVKYFGDSGALKARRGKKLLDRTYGMIIDDYDGNQARVAGYDGDGVGRSWWLRSPGSSASCAAYVEKEGFINMTGINIHLFEWQYVLHGVRPALWVNR